MNRYLSVMILKIEKKQWLVLIQSAARDLPGDIKIFSGMEMDTKKA
jgi:hypothetical protein